jgi:chromosome segregation and condensation protein ScpB
MMTPARAAVLLAFHDENAVLTKPEIRKRTGQPDDSHIHALLDMGLLARREWVPNAPRQLYLTPHGRDKREECVAGD